ncbi:transcriptional regulator [Secundilactobacillus oryzae JCM 18671]|uniref:Transcriptional regulator n=1 Tax=Secundilactobacillus oryzae JCM 18671 TaxID=1291743 RepID=A0A081BH07_9LACO|nr:LysR family transcriptional regulator [Secundilactobacillus oryzae]GAK47325.1 transcriptional regulator [Secundilactobacillus oryzae JCM 18671]
MLPFAYQVFSAVVQEGSFYKASLLLNVTPSAISHSISQLEKDLGFPVFIRNRGGVELTQSGHLVLPLIQEVINSQSRLRQEADRINGLSVGSVRLGAFSSTCISWVPPIIQSFREAYPDIKVSVYQDNDFNGIVQAVKDGTIDVGFTSLPVNENLEVKQLLRDEIYCIAPKGFKPKNPMEVTADDIADKSFILQHGDYDRDTKAALDHYNIRPNSIQFSIDDQSILAMVEAGLGFGILPELALQKISGNVEVFPFDKRFYRTICMVTTKVGAKTPATEKMMGKIEEYVNGEYGS